MIYYLILLTTGILIDIKDLKGTNKKSDVVFYIIAMVICVTLGIFYFANTNREGIAEMFVKMFGLGGL